AVFGERGVRIAAADRVSGAESSAVRLDDEHLHVVVTVGERERVIEGAHHLRRLRVRLLRPVEDEPRDGAVRLVDHRPEFTSFHSLLLTTRSRTRAARWSDTAEARSTRKPRRARG